jgi:hypothetical protein
MAEHHHVRAWLRHLRERSQQRAQRGDVRSRAPESRDRDAKRSKLHGGQPGG